MACMEGAAYNVTKYLPTSVAGPRVITPGVKCGSGHIDGLWEAAQDGKQLLSVRIPFLVAAS